MNARMDANGWRKSMDVEVSQTAPERKARKPRRDNSLKPVGVPYIIRNIPTYDILSEDNLQKIEKTADRILSEVGIEFRDDPASLDHWKRAGAKVDGVLVRFEPGLLQELVRTAPAQFTCPQSRPQCRDWRKVRCFCARLWVALCHGSGQGPSLRNIGRLSEFHQTGLFLALASPFRRHDL
jgi:trimethylamine:corrinoid methyltransferase-like protein